MCKTLNKLFLFQGNNAKCQEVFNETSLHSREYLKSHNIVSQEGLCLMTSDQIKEIPKIGDRNQINRAHKRLCSDTDIKTGKYRKLNHMKKWKNPQLAFSQFSHKK